MLSRGSVRCLTLGGPFQQSPLCIGGDRDGSGEDRMSPQTPVHLLCLDPPFSLGAGL